MAYVVHDHRKMKLALIILPAALLAGCSSLYHRQRARTFDAARLGGVAELVLVGGKTSFAVAQENMLQAMEKALNSNGCLQVNRQANSITMTPPPRVEKFQADGTLLDHLPSRAANIGVLLIWVTEWTGEKYRKENFVGDVVQDVADTLVLTPLLGASPSEKSYRYQRGASARLISADTGTLLWSADKFDDYWEPLDEKGRKPSVSETALQEQAASEIREFQEFLTRELIDGGACTGYR